MVVGHVLLWCMLEMNSDWFRMRNSVFLCKKTTADGHEELDGEMYGKYFTEQFLLIQLFLSTMRPTEFGETKNFQQNRDRQN
jgi:hypothetical protein